MIIVGSRLHQFSKVLDQSDPHKFRPLPKCPHQVWAKPRPINASSQFVQNMLDSKVGVSIIINRTVRWVCLLLLIEYRAVRWVCLLLLIYWTVRWVCLLLLIVNSVTLWWTHWDCPD